MPRPLQGNERKVDVGLTLNRKIYERAKAHARKKHTSVSSLVDSLLEAEIARSKKKTSRPAPAPNIPGLIRGDSGLIASRPERLGLPHAESAPERCAASSVRDAEHPSDYPKRK